MSESISVIIPVLNEVENVEEMFRHAHPIADELIIVDGGSTDGTVEKLNQLECTVIQSERGRGQQLCAGAAFASGSILLFLHADTYLPCEARSQILGASEALSGSDRSLFCGCFRQRINSPKWIYRWIESGNLWRARYQRLPYGDQGVFVSRRLYDEVGGMPKISLMEDFEFAKRISRRGNLIILPGPIRVDVRRWEKVGPVRQTLRNWSLALRYRLGFSPEKLVSRY